MPRKKGYTAAQKKAYAKRMANKRKPKRAVQSQNQFRTELKDRVAAIRYTTTANPAITSVFDGPEDSSTLLPWAMLKSWDQGTANGQIDGNQVNARYCNMKVQLDFSQLVSLVTSGGVANQHQYYDIKIRQCWILEDISDNMTYDYTNPASGRVQKAFSSLTAGQDDPDRKYQETAQIRLRNQNIDADYMSYERRQDTKVRVMKTIHVEGDQNAQFVARAAATGGTSSFAMPTPDQYYTFQWKMPKNKLTLQPTIGTDAALTGHVFGKTWIPCVIVTCDRAIVDDNIATHPLNIAYVSHFTYTDN